MGPKTGQIDRFVGPGHRGSGASFRAGFNLIGLILLILILGAAGLFFSQLARQSSRSSHWFHQGQLAYNLADSALKHVCFELQQANSVGRAQAMQGLSQELIGLIGTLTGAGAPGGSVVVLSSSRPATVPRALGDHLADLAEWSPTVEVAARIGETKPLWEGLKHGLPADPAERRGQLLITAHASVKHRTGLRTDRSIVLGYEYKVVSLLPPLLGRFALFVKEGPTVDPNFVKVEFNDQSGNGQHMPGPSPLVVTSPTRARLTDPGLKRLDRTAIARDLADPKFLDRQGWIYLGGGERGDRRWTLRLAHGYSDLGESPLLPSTRDLHLFKGRADEDLAFKQRFVQTLNGGSGPSRCTVGFPDPQDGLYYFHHGTAAGFERIGIDADHRTRVRSAAVAFGALCNGDASALRLFGRPEEISPTLVFGPVCRSYFRRAFLQLTYGQPDLPAGSAARCQTTWRKRVPFLRLEDHQGLLGDALLAAFGSRDGYDDFGTALVEKEPFIRSLDVVLTASGLGEFNSEGRVDPVPAATTTVQPVYASDLLPWLCSLPAVGGLPPEVEKKLWEGAMTSSGKLFEGNLGNGLLAFHAAMREKVTYQFQSRDSFRRRCLAGGTLRLPGIAVIGESETLQLPAIQKVADGGILLHSGEIRVTGDITRGGTGEPLTLVSLQKDIVIGPGVGRIEAQLIALDGSVRFGSTNDVVIEGGVSTRTLALEDLRDRPAHRVVRYAPELDPLGPTRATAVRVFFGGKAGKPLISVSGGG